MDNCQIPYTHDDRQATIKEATNKLKHDVNSYFSGDKSLILHSCILQWHIYGVCSTKQDSLDMPLILLTFLLLVRTQWYKCTVTLVPMFEVRL